MVQDTRKGNVGSNPALKLLDTHLFWLFLGRLDAGSSPVRSTILGREVGYRNPLPGNCAGVMSSSLIRSTIYHYARYEPFEQHYGESRFARVIVIKIKVLANSTCSLLSVWDFIILCSLNEESQT